MKVRVERHTDHVAAMVEFYRDRVGLPEIGGFYRPRRLRRRLPQASRQRSAPRVHQARRAPRAAPHPENLLVLWLEDGASLAEFAERICLAPAAPDKSVLAGASADVRRPGRLRLDRGRFAGTLLIYDEPRARR
jgi:hypothetical protein